MRLSQLARKLDKSPSEIILFYKAKNIGTYDSHNDKLEAEHVKIAISHYNPDLLIVKEEKESIEDNDKNSINVEVIEDEELIVAPDEEIIKEKTDSDSEYDEEIEVIRAPKIKLEGVKVVGKIELPEKVIKESKKNANKEKIEKSIPSSSEKKEIKRSLKKAVKNQNRSKQTKRLSYEERLKLEEKEQKRKKREEYKRNKELKKIHYKKNIQSKVISTEKNKLKKSLNFQNEAKREIPVYKNPIRRFWAWLNGEYDSY